MKELENKIKDFCRSRVINGPFTGMYVDQVDKYGPGHVILKWLGTYEQPIHVHVENEISNNHDAFLNIGCGDGYYAVGVKSKSPSTDIYMFDIDVTCNDQVKENCQLNGINDYTFANNLDLPEFQRILGKYIDPWIFMDIEGAEVDFLCPDVVNGLHKSTITVEMHDCFRMGVTNELIARFQNTHKIINIVDDWKKKIPNLPNDILLPNDVLEFITYERRCTRMNWLHMIPYYQILTKPLI